MDIIIQSGKKASHSFDVWGTLIDKFAMGLANIDTYKGVAEENKVDPETVNRVVTDYQGLLDGTPEALARKIEVIEALDGYLEQYGIKPDASKAVYDDVVPTLHSIQEAGEDVIIFSSKGPEIILGGLPEDIGAKLRLYAGDKNHAGTFQDIYGQEQAAGAHMVSHTGDEEPELFAARESGLFEKQGMIYVFRNGADPKLTSEFRSTDNLEKICYTQER